MQTANEKRNLGAFYTPDKLTEVLCNWAIQCPSDTILEPSFGGCGFLKSAKDRLVRLGQNHPANQLFGCDVDVNAFGHLQDIFEHPVDVARFYHGDFLSLVAPLTWPKSFTTVIGNPPYLPYRKIDQETRTLAAARLAQIGCVLDLRSSLWAYFAALSCAYLEDGGRMAWVLPSSFLHANYAKALRSFFANSFEVIHAFELQERQFLTEGTEEQSIVLLAKGFKGHSADGENAATDNSSTDIRLTRCDKLGDLVKAIDKWEAGELRARASCGSCVIDHLPSLTRKLFDELDSEASSKKLGDILDIRIGLVTGDNNFFVLSRDDTAKHKIPQSACTPIVPKFKYVRRLSYIERDHNNLVDQGGRGFLVGCNDLSKASKSVRTYFNAYPAALRDARSTFKKRALWHQADDRNPPDAFFPVMHHLGPRIALNPEQYQCTNTIHRAYFRAGTSERSKMLVAISILSSFSQISSEIEGRSYGAGVLKHEPREAERIRLLMPSLSRSKVKTVFDTVECLLSAGDDLAARKTVDLFILAAIGRSNPSSDHQMLSAALQKIRSHRHR